jgi:hypothetical protein
MTRYALFIAALAVAGCETATAPRSIAPDAPAAAVVRNDRFERVTLAGNDCTGEVVAIDATFHLVTAVTYDATGAYHVTIHRNVEGTGVNEATGVEYVVSEADNNQYTVGAGATEQTSIMHFNLVSKGAAPNEVAQVMFHLTITPDGDLSTYHDSFRFDCGS